MSWIVDSILHRLVFFVYLEGGGHPHSQPLVEFADNFMCITMSLETGVDMIKHYCCDLNGDTSNEMIDNGSTDEVKTVTKNYSWKYMHKCLTMMRQIFLSATNQELSQVLDEFSSTRLTEEPALFSVTPTCSRCRILKRGD